MLNRIQLALRSVEAVFDAVTSLAMFVVMVLVSTDVAMRYLFNHPLSWSYDVISMYLMATVFLLALSSTLRHNHHVRVDILFQLASPRARMAMELVGYTLMAIVMSGIFYKGAVKTWTSYQAGDVVMTSVAWPTWLSAVLIPLGVGLLMLRLLFGICSFAVALATGAERAPGMDPLPERTDA